MNTPQQRAYMQPSLGTPISIQIERSGWDWPGCARCRPLIRGCQRSRQPGHSAGDGAVWGNSAPHCEAIYVPFCRIGHDPTISRLFLPRALWLQSQAFIEMRTNRDVSKHVKTENLTLAWPFAKCDFLL